MDKNIPVHVLVNPASQSGAGLKVWEKVRDHLREAGLQPQVHMSDPQHSLSALAEEISAAGKELTLLVVGGDGSMNEVLCGIQNPDKVILGYIPTGSSNDFARAIGQNSVELALDTIMQSVQPVHRDLGKLVYTEPETGQEKIRFFNVSAGLGFDAAACEAANRSGFKRLFNKLHLGKIIYLFVSIRLIFTSRLIPCEIEWLEPDPQTGQSINRHMKLKHTLFAVCMNHGYEGGGFLFCPDADAADGKLDLCATHDISRLKFLRMFPLAYDGRHVGHDGVEIRQACSFTLRVDEPCWFHVDGEVPGKTACMTASVLPGRLRFWN